MAEGRKSRAGFFSLCLNTAHNPKSKHLKYRIAVADKLLKDFRSLNMSKNAILNLKGVFMFYCIDELKASIDCFKNVLEVNKHNKNAIAHMITVYQRLHMNSKAKQYKERLEHFEEQRKSHGQLNTEREYSIGDIGQDNFLFHYYDAEALAEQGIAFFMDCYTEEDEWVRNNRALKLFDESLRMISRLVNLKLEDRTQTAVEQLELEVKYWLSQCYQKVHQGVCRRDTTVQQPGFKDSYCEGIKYLRDITRSDKALIDLKGWAWAFLGVFCFKKPKNLQGKTLEDFEKYIASLGLNDEFQNPDICFQKALDLEREDNQSTETRIRYATYLRTFRNKEKLEDAITQLQKAWELCPEEGNWFAKTMLAQVNISMYWVLKNSKKDSEQEHETEKKLSADYLNNAIRYGEEALRINTTAMDLANVAEAYYLRGRNSDGTMDGDSDDAMSAAEYFWQAVQCLGTEKKPEVHRKHGVFLRAIGEDRQAIECFKRGMEVSVPARPADNFDKLFETFLEMYSKEREHTKPGQKDDNRNITDNGPTDVSTEPTQVSEGATKHTAASLQNTDVCAERFEGTQQAATADKSKVQKIPSDAGGEQLEKSENETFSSASSSGSPHDIIDLEVDLGLLSKDEVGQGLPSKGEEIEQSGETWVHKQNDILYEMAYWYQYAMRNFDNRRLTECTKKYLKKYPEEMCMMHAYFKLDTDAEKRNFESIRVMEEALQSRKSEMKDSERENQDSESDSQSEVQTIYQKKMDYAKKVLSLKIKEQEEQADPKQSHCKHCSQPYPVASISRQTSVIPDVVPRPRNTFYKYDFYVIFSRSERDWVYYSLLQKLEKSYQFKGAIPERDYKLGHSSFAEMERCIRESLKVLIILSNNVTKNEEMRSMYEIDFALKVHHDMARSHYIVPVLKDDDCLPPRQLSTLTCVNAVHSNAWEKIVMALESKQ